MFDWKNQTKMKELYQVSNEPTLKQYHCELPIKKEKYPHCGKTTNRANNLEKHLRSCETAPTHPTKWQLHQPTLDGPISSENGPATPKKLMVEEVKLGGPPAEQAEHSALKYTAFTFRMSFSSNNRRDLLQQLKEVIHSMRPVIVEQTRASAEAVK